MMTILNGTMNIYVSDFQLKLNGWIQLTKYENT